MDDKSGIYSLAGFAYQILVFGLLIPKMQEGDVISFETIDDVETKLTQEKLDEKDNVVEVISTSEHCAIQVKKTDITKGKAEKIIKNWMLTEIGDPTIDKYLLYTDRDNVELDIFDKVSAEDIVEQVVNAAERASSINMRLKNSKYSEADLIKICRSVIRKANVKKFVDFEDEIKKVYQRFFLSTAVSQYVYIGRIKEFLCEIATEILGNVITGNSYYLEFDHVVKLQHQVIISITDEHIEPSYSEFTKLNKINLADLAIANSREYKQLCECKLKESTILRNLIWGEYYANCKYGYYEVGKKTVVDDIEITAYENFCDTKDRLQSENQDTPRNRLDGTKNMPNEYARNDQIRYGVCIGLTKDNVDSNLQISWKD